MKRAKDIEIIPIKVRDDDKIPSHPDFPLLIYKSVFEDGDDIPVILNSNDWSGSGSAPSTLSTTTTATPMK